MPRSIELYAKPFAILLFVFLAVIFLNGFYFINLDAWRYSAGGTGAVARLTPVLLTVLNRPIYALFGTWGEMTVQLAIVCYVLVRISVTFGFRLNAVSSPLLILGTFFIFIADTYMVDVWAPLLFLLIAIIGKRGKISPIDCLLLFIAAGSHNAHVLMGVCAVVLAVVLRMLSVRKAGMILLTIVATVPVNSLLRSTFYPGIQPLRYSFPASDILLKDPENFQGFCLTHQQNSFCQDPYKAKVERGRSEHWPDLLWASNSLMLSTPDLQGKPLTTPQMEAASKELVLYTALNNPFHFLKKAIAGTGKEVFGNPLGNLGWNKFYSDQIRQSWFSYLSPYLPAIDTSLQVRNYFLQPRMLGLGMIALVALYASFIGSLTLAIYRRDKPLVRLHLYVLVCFFGAALLVASISVMANRYYARNLILLGIPIAAQFFRSSRSNGDASVDDVPVGRCRSS